MPHMNPSEIVAFMETYLSPDLGPETAPSHLDIHLAKMLRQVIIDAVNATAFDVLPDTTLEFRESFEEFETVEMERPSSPPPEEYVPEEPVPGPSTSRFDDPDLDYKRRAVEYWRNYKKGYKSRKTVRTLESVQQKFKKVKSFSQLYAWKNYIDRGGSRFDKSKLIANRVLDKFREEVGVNAIIHDNDIQSWALEANREIHLENFIASKTWLFNFKRNNNIVRRDVGKLIVRAEGGSLSTEQLELIDQFRLMIKNERIAQLGAENVLNAAECELTSTFSVILVISAAGKLLPPLTVTISDETIISNKEVEALTRRIPGLHIVRSKFEAQESQNVRRWLDKVCENYSGIRNCLIIDDQIAIVKDIVEVSDRLDVQEIPYGTEFMLRPLSEGIKVWKRFVKAINDHVDVTENCDFDRNLVENYVKVQAFVHSQLTADRYNKFFATGWQKFELLEVEEQLQEHTDPVIFAFGRELRSNNCQFCSELSFLRCARCDKFICFEHALMTLNSTGFHDN